MRDIKVILGSHFSHVKEFLGETYLIFYLNKLAVLINKKFMDNIFLIKRIGDSGLKILQQDLAELKDVLHKLCKIDNENKEMQSYINFVNKTIQKS